MTTPAQRRLTELRRLKQLTLALQETQAAEALKQLAYSDYRTKARPQQLPPEGDWRIWLILAGRGFGKTWTGSKWLLEKALQTPGTEWAVVAPTFGDVRRICVEGPSGIIKSAQPGQIKFYNKSNGQINLANGSVIHMISADEPDRARGLNLAGAWCDEFAAWRYEETWTEGLVPALRIGNPQVVITTTPRPTRLLKALLKRSDGSVVLTRGSTFDNAANLSQAALQELRARYEGTRLGRQELYGEVLEDVEGALWSLNSIETTRIDDTPELRRIVVAVDPAVTSGPDSDETGIVVAGLGYDGRGYVLADRSTRDTPLGWAKRVIAAFEEFQADRIVAEKNQGGDLVEMNLKQVSPAIPYKGITAKQGKRLRAEPIAALYEQGRISHVGNFPQLEQQMTEWVPDSGTSPDRLDALVHALTELGFMGGGSADRFLASISATCDKCAMPIDPGAQSCRYCGQTNATGAEGAPFMPFAYPT
jgi:phage terminase large subunit-like protein